MDKRSRLDHENDGKSAKGKNNTKEAALDKLRQMEWMRNKQDTWHLARADSRKEEGYVKKKYNKDDSYFEGTGSQKTKKVRKSRQVETNAAAMVPSGFARAIASAPPPVNAWAQKKGSALFNKQPEEEEVDDEDEMLKLVLKESLKTAEEDQRRHIERMKMNVREMPPFQTEEPTRNNWKVEEDQWSEVQHSPSSSATNRDLHFVDSDSADDTPPPRNQRRKPSQLRNRKSSSPNEKSPVANMNNTTKRLHSHNKQPSMTTVNDFDISFEPLQPRTIYPDLGETNYDHFKQPLEQKEPVVLTHKESSPQVIREVKNNLTPVDDLCSDLSSNLTFGDMQNSEDSNHIPKDVRNNFHFETQSCEPSEPYRSKPIMIPNSTSSIGIPGYPENVDDTDIILHRFIRHDPPSTLDKHGSLEFYSKDNPQLYSPNMDPDPRALEQNHLLRNGLVQDSSQSVLQTSSGQVPRQPESNSPFQSVSPYGSFGKETLSGLPQTVHHMLSPLSLPYAVNVQNNQEACSNLYAMQVAANRNVASHMTYGIAHGYPLLHQTIQSIPPGLNQFNYSNTNVVVPPNLQNLAQQQRVFQQQQTQLTGMETIHSEPNVLQNQPQMMNPKEHQPQMMSPREPQLQMTVSQNQLLMLQQAQLQMHSPVNQPLENTVQKAVELVHEISPEQGIQQPVNKTREELQREYDQAMQYVYHLKQQMANAAQPSVDQEHQFYNYPCTLPMPIGNNNNILYPGVQMMPSSQQPLPLVTQPSQEALNIQLSVPEFHSELNTATGGVGLTQATSNPAVGRGRGRLQ